MKNTYYKAMAYSLIENFGYFTRSCRDKVTALKLINLCLKEDEYEPVKLEDIEEDVMYRCGDCEFFNIGENMCCECGGSLKSRPRKTFVYYFPI